eukprot:scaffold103445_cov58-Attheya_sp.AAC.6
MASSLLKKKERPGSDEVVSALEEVMGNALSWEAVETQLEQQQTPEERAFRQNLIKGYGAASPLHKVRLYDESNKEEDVRVTFYRDSASWCPYCQKVWMTLEEKRIPYRIIKINMRCYGEKPLDFQRLQPSGAIPVVKIDETVYRQSNDALYALEESFPSSPELSPAKTDDPMKAQKLLRLERTLFSVWMYWLTSSGDPKRYKKEFVSVLAQVEDELKQSPGAFFMGKKVNMVDIMFVPFLERICASLLYFKGFQIRVPPNTKTDFPNINKWFDAMEELESYQLTKSDYYTHCWDLPPQLGGCTFEPAGEPYERAINGERKLSGNGGSWELPLEAHNEGIEPDWTFGHGKDPEAARREAAERITANHAAIVQFAARGAGSKGFPPYSAPLADPNAKAGSQQLQAVVDSFLRLVCKALLSTDHKLLEPKLVEASQALLKGDDRSLMFSQDVVQSLAYLRDRTGVPRDMRLPAAQQLRAHLNWVIGGILEAQENSS